MSVLAHSCRLRIRQSTQFCYELVIKGKTVKAWPLEISAFRSPSINNRPHQLVDIYNVETMQLLYTQALNQIKQTLSSSLFVIHTRPICYQDISKAQLRNFTLTLLHAFVLKWCSSANVSDVCKNQMQLCQAAGIPEVLLELMNRTSSFYLCFVF